MGHCSSNKRHLSIVALNELPTPSPQALELPALRLALRVADLGGVAAAARELNLLPATATASIRRLESQLGVKLFARSSRALRPTAEARLSWRAAEKHWRCSTRRWASCTRR